MLNNLVNTLKKLNHIIYITKTSITNISIPKRALLHAPLIKKHSSYLAAKSIVIVKSRRTIKAVTISRIIARITSRIASLYDLKN